ncbi:conserved domain protein [Rhodobacteraceae bacterium KLH11]|nr:conserved domain protein [Rhodobacteraceae bacterium KLH11]
MTRPFIITALLALLAACDQSAGPSTELANPAATFCIEQGGEYQIQDGADGQTGICTLPDGSKQDAWDYFRAQHVG